MSAEQALRISAIIPAFNEARTITRCVECCRAVADEAVVVDAGSSDGTVQLALAAGARLVHAEKGRGPQLNRGAEEARGQILLFVHADTLLPAAARRAILSAIENGRDAGNFKLRFEPETRAGRAYAYLNHLRRRAFAI